MSQISQSGWFAIERGRHQTGTEFQQLRVVAGLGYCRLTHV